MKEDVRKILTQFVEANKFKSDHDGQLAGCIHELLKETSWRKADRRKPDHSGYYITCSDIGGTPQCIGITYYDNSRLVWVDNPFDDVSEQLSLDYWLEIPKL